LDEQKSKELAMTIKPPLSLICAV